jgi:16S rRNA (uracil1498-N3)-methyltransferase
MERFYCPDLTLARLSERETHHAKDVLRLKENDLLTVFDGCGKEWKATIISLGKSLSFRKLTEVKTPAPSYRLTLAQAIPKGKAMDLILQKATELGVTEIIPLLSERIVAKVGEDSAEEKVVKWREVTIEAAKQSGQNWIPSVTPPMKLKDFLSEQKKTPAKLIASLQPEARPLKQTLQEFTLENKQPLRHVVVMIGPEGDFTPAEIGEARAGGFLPISLGPLILRSETAALYTLSILKYEIAG